jgi:hypothetical protein
MDYQVDFTKAYKDLYEGIAAKGGVMGKGKDTEEKKPAEKPDAKAKSGDKKEGEGDESAVKQAVYDIRYRAKREGVPVAQAMTDYLKHSASLGPKARAELKKKLLGEENLDEISANLALTASQKADEVRRKAAIAGDRETAAKKAQQASRIYKGVASRRAKERVEELYKGKHGQSEKEYQDSRSDGGKMVSGDSKHSGAAYSHRSFKGVGKPAKPGERQKNQGKMDRGTRADIAYRKANLKKEDVDQVDELYKGKHGQSEKEYQDSRSQGGKMVSGDSKGSGAKYTHGRRVDDGGAGPQPAGGSKKPKAQGRMDRGTRADLSYRKANLKAKKEEYTLGELKAILEDESLSYVHADVFDLIESFLIGEEVIGEESSKKSQKGETLYKVRVVNNDDRAEVRYASRAKISQLRSNDNIKSVEITGHGDAYNEKPKKGGEKKLDPVGKEDGDVDNDGDQDSSDKYLMKRRKAIGKAMTKEEYVDENRAAARSAGGYKDDSKKQPDPSKKGFTGVGNMSIDQIRKMSARIEKEKSAKK